VSWSSLLPWKRWKPIWEPQASCALWSPTTLKSRMLCRNARLRCSRRGVKKDESSPRTQLNEPPTLAQHASNLPRGSWRRSKSFKELSAKNSCYITQIPTDSYFFRSTALLNAASASWYTIWKGISNGSLLRMSRQLRSNPLCSFPVVLRRRSYVTDRQSWRSYTLFGCANDCVYCYIPTTIES